MSKKSLYFALDFDKRIKSIELLNKNIQVMAFVNGSNLPLIESEILNNGGLYQNKLDYVVIDPINFLLKDLNIIELIIKLKKLEEEYNKFKLIVTINTLHHFELREKIKKIPGIEFIECKY
jgi:adenylyl- and sulfurtransferase ThiI